MTSTNKIQSLIIKSAALLLLMISMCCAFSCSKASESSEKIRIPAELREGDLILRRGKSLFSMLITQYFPEAREMSHVGIVIKEEGVWRVVHSISGRLDSVDGIRIEDLEKFCGDAHEGDYHFVSADFEIDRVNAASRARYYLEKETPFDHSFDLDDDEAMYCSELIRTIYLQSGAEDIFSYAELSGIRLLDLASFFDPRYWHLLD